MPNPVVSDAPWSAAFISWVVKTAAQRAEGTAHAGLVFPYIAAHSQYAQAIRDNPTKYPFDLLDPYPNGSPRELEPGDIAVYNRGGNNLKFSSPKWEGFSHGDIVVEDRFGEGGVMIGGNLSDAVKQYTVRNLSDYFVIIRAKSDRHRELIKNVAREERNTWINNKWTNERQPGARERVSEYWLATGLPYIPPEQFATVPVPPQIIPPSANSITPYIEALESFHPKIQYELTRRRVASETANTYMPFVKLTSLSKVLSDNLPDGQSSAYCPSLGIHGEDNVSFDDIYSTKSNRSIIGYAFTEDGVRTVPVIVSDSSKDAQNIPIPGITQINAERSTAGPMGVRGGLLKADLKIVAYSVGQVDTLLRYFLRPATRVVLELGRLSSNPNEKQITPFDWNKKETEISDYFSELIKSPKKQEEFIKQYIYNNYGKYEAFIAYVVKFNLKYNKNNTFEIDLTLHSVQQFEVPTKHTAVQSICPSPTTACNVMDIQEYFSDSYSWKNNHFTKLMSYYQGQTVNGTTAIGVDAKWKSQIVPIKNKKDNETGAASTQAGTRENEYFVSWKFFVEKILNDRRYGVASMLGNDTSTRAISDLALLRPVLEPTSSLADSGLISNQVGYHPNLRSVNPGVMVIYNSEAQKKYEQSTDKPLFESLNNAAASGSREVLGALQNTALAQQISGSSLPFTNVSGSAGEAGYSYLSRGVWINTQAIKQAFTSTDTISSAISSLLSMMNSATEGYWNLQLYSTDRNNPGLHVIDMGLSKQPKLVSGSLLSIDKEETNVNNILNSINGINLTRYQGANEDEPKYIYMFNRGTKRFNDGELGSDLIDLNVEFNLPQVIAVQAIANIGGPAQKGLLNTIDVKELREISLIKGLYTPCSNPTDDGDCESDEIRNAREAARKAQRELENAQLRERTARAVQPSARGVDPLAPGATISPGSTFIKEATTLRAAQDRVNVALANQFNPNLVGTIREYADLGTALQLIEINPSRMMKQLNLDSTNAEDGRVPSRAHAFNSSNLTKTVVDVTLPGIGGINLFQSFLVDRVPSIIDRGFYVVTKITHEFSSQNGWITKIQGRFRYRPGESK